MASGSWSVEPDRYDLPSNLGGETDGSLGNPTMALFCKASCAMIGEEKQMF